MTRIPRLIVIGLLALPLGAAADTEVASGAPMVPAANATATSTASSAACSAAEPRHPAANAGVAVPRFPLTQKTTVETEASVAAVVDNCRVGSRSENPGNPGSHKNPGTLPPPPVAGSDRPEDPIAHDATMVKEGDWYYLAITGDAATGHDYIPMKRSKDLLHWEQLPPVFTQLPAEVVAAIPDVAPPAGVGAAAPADAWAPDLSWTGSQWRLYYSASRFGTTNSVIAMATSKSLDPASPDFGWIDQGIVLETEPGASYNAIDANYVQDAQGGAWLTFGSFFAGIQIIAVDPSTGKPAAGAEPRTIATRPINYDPIEGSTVIRRGDYFYLFASFDYCCRGVDSDYRIVVGRSTSITGPYVDMAGVSMLDGGGTEVLRGYNEFQGTGHPDVFSSGGVDYFVNHYYDLLSGGTPRLNVRTLSWAHGWPRISDPVNPSRWAGHGSAYVRIFPRRGGAVVGTVGCGYAGANLALVARAPKDSCQEWQIDARDAVQVTDGSETGSRFQNRHSNMSADFPGCAEAETSGNVGQFDWLGSFFFNICQRWVFSASHAGYTTITSIAGRNLVWTDEGRTPGSNLAVATPTDAVNQQFRFGPVGQILLGGSVDRTQTLGVKGCQSNRAGKDLRGDEIVRLETRTIGSCQTWTMASTGGARYTVTNVATGLQLSSSPGKGHPHNGLTLAAATSGQEGRRRWTLVPNNDGTWSLSNHRNAALTVRLLIP